MASARGTLLNAYGLFYVKSGSGWTAVLFFVVIALLLVNELPGIRKIGPVVLYGLYSFCLTSYFAYLYPVLLGRIRSWVFLLAVATSAVPLALLNRFHHRRTGDRRQVIRHALLPSLGAQIVWLALYVFRLLPPVPLSLMEIGIYHNVTRDPDGSYRVEYETPAWFRFWVRDDADFRARSGDRVYSFFRVFAPRGFHATFASHGSIGSLGAGGCGPATCRLPSLADARAGLPATPTNRTGGRASGECLWTRWMAGKSAGARFRCETTRIRRAIVP